MTDSDSESAEGSENNEEDTTETELEKRMLPFANKSELTADLTLIVEGRELYVSKAMLLLASPVFRRMLTTGFLENDLGKIPLPEKKVKGVVEFLRCIHPGILEHIDEDNAFKIIPLADEYECMALKTMGEEFLVESITTDGDIDYVITCILFAEKYHLDKLLEECVNFLYKKHSFDLKGTKFNQISERSRILIFKKRTISLEDKCGYKPAGQTDETPFKKRKIKAVTVDN